MTGFLYYVPGRSQPTDDDLIARGLDSVLTNPIANQVLQNGLDDGAGYTLADRSIDSAMVRLVREHQTWRAGPPGEEGPQFWIGFYNDNPPTPDDLIRPEHCRLPGPVVELEQHKWIVPRLREWREGDIGPIYTSSVPRLLDFGESGQPVRGDVVPRYAELWEQSCRVTGLISDQLFTGSSASLESEDLLDFACRCLSTNYRVTLVELAVMKCASEADAARVVRIALDADGLENHLKNHLSRLASEITDFDSGAKRQTTDAPTDSPTDPQLVS